MIDSSISQTGHGKPEHVDGPLVRGGLVASSAGSIERDRMFSELEVDREALCFEQSLSTLATHWYSQDRCDASCRTKFDSPRKYHRVPSCSPAQDPCLWPSASRSSRPSTLPLALPPFTPSPWSLPITASNCDHSASTDANSLPIWNSSQST